MSNGDFPKENLFRIGVAAAFALAGLLIITVGFIETVFIGVLACAGWFAAQFFINPDRMKDFLDKYLGRR